MVRIVTILIFLYNLSACKESVKKADESLSVAKNDTFDFFGDEYDIPILPGFAVDTIKFYDKTTDYTETLICPSLLDKVYKRPNEILKKEIKRKAAFAYLDTTDTNPVDTSKEVFGITIDNILLQMHKGKNAVSYGFLAESNAPNQMRPFRRYFSVNYDTTLKHFILFSDYFKISSHDDSALVRSIIYSRVGNPDFDHVRLDNEINFSFDDKNIYFYFDMFGGPGNPMGLVKRVKRKYLDNFIINDYK